MGQRSTAFSPCCSASRKLTAVNQSGFWANQCGTTLPNEQRCQRKLHDTFLSNKKLPQRDAVAVRFVNGSRSASTTLSVSSAKNLCHDFHNDLPIKWGTPSRLDDGHQEGKTSGRERSASEKHRTRNRHFALAPPNRAATVQGISPGNHCSDPGGLSGHQDLAVFRPPVLA